jgi:hypothetical protein
MDHKTEEYWGTLILRMAADAHREGDLVTTELLGIEAMQYFDRSDRLEARWRNFELRLDNQLKGAPVTRH